MAERILDTTFRLSYARGIEAVGVDLIIAESGVARATFYSTSRPRMSWSSPTWTGSTECGPANCTTPRTQVPDPADQLVGLFDALGTACRRDGYRGCVLINTAAEARPGSPVHERTVAHKQAVLSWVPDLAARAGGDDANSLAGLLTLLLDGGLADGALAADPEAPRAARTAARSLVAAALTSAV